MSMDEFNNPTHLNNEDNGMTLNNTSQLVVLVEVE